MIVLAHAGKQHSYHVALEMHRLGALEKFHTSSYIRSSWLQEALTRRDNTFWTRRFIEGLPGEKVVANWRFELKELAYRKLFGNDQRIRNLVYARDVAFDRYMARQLPHSAAAVFWGFQGSCHESLKAAWASGKIPVCELATAHVTAARRILQEEQQLHPEWAHTIDNLVFPPAYEQRLREEPHLADWVVAASQFTRRTLLEDSIPAEKIIDLPLGFDLEHIPPPSTDSKRRPGPLRLLYAGRITQRKGVKYLLEAMREFSCKDVELHLIGNLNAAEDALKSYQGSYTYHTPVSQAELFRQYQEYDALVLPTVFEGFGLVIVEAMAAGLPAITTAHSIGPDLIRDDVNGYLTPIRDISAIQQAVERLLGKSAEERDNMRRAAREAALEFSWDAYRHRLATVLQQTFPS